MPDGPAATAAPTTGQQGRGVTYQEEKEAREGQPLAPEVRQIALLALTTIRHSRMRALGLS
jgi:hypothetical protein